MKKLKRTAASVMIGNALEMYDFALYGIFAKIIADEFFPKTDPTAALLATLAIYASGFFMRPFGGIIFGFLGDKFGRRWILSITMLLMATPTFIIGILPSYETIGVVAPIIILACRLLQGLCAGAEYNGASIFLIEHFNAKKLPAFAGSLVSASGAIGSILGLFAYYLVSNNLLHWREPFIFGSIIVLIAFYIHRFTDESLIMQKNSPNVTIWPLLKVLKSYRASLFVTIAIGGFQGTLIYLLFVYLKIYMTTQTTLHLEDIAFFNFISLLSFLLFTPLFGFYAGKLGHIKVMRVGLVITLLYIYPCFAIILSHDYSQILISQIFLGMLIGLSACSTSAVMNSLFPPHLRCSGILFGYNLGVAIFGGTLPLASEWYISTYGNQYIPAIFCIFIIALSLITIQLLIPRKMVSNNEFALSEIN